jgi:lipopolysaccharide export system protein LptA
VEHDDGANVLANRADYSKRAGAVVFTGNPHWRQEQIEGSAERVTFKPATKEVEADKNVAVKITLPPKGGGSMLTLFSQGATNQTTQVIEIASRRLTLKQGVKQGQALFTGDVGAFQSPRTGIEPRLHSDKLEVLFAPGGGRLDSLTAKDNVTLEQNAPGMTNYNKLTCRSLVTKTDGEGNPKELVADGGVRIEQPGSVARAEQAVYNSKTDVLKLIGKPVIEMPEGTYTGAHEVEWDKKNKTVSGADYKITGSPEAVKRLKSAAESQKLPGQ